MKYKTELHCHSRDGSGCSSESVEGIVKKYLEYGYSTILLTNHFGPPSDPDNREAWLNEIASKYAAYEKLVSAADGKLNILMGLEFRCRDNSNDYLGFGFTREYLENLDPHAMKNIRTFSEKVRSDGIYLIQAHPFRFGMVMTNPNYLDGIEVFNGHPGHQSHNELANALADLYGKTKTSGTDHHDPIHMPRGGIITDEPITSEAELIGALRSGMYELIR